MNGAWTWLLGTAGVLLVPVVLYALADGFSAVVASSATRAKLRRHRIMRGLAIFAAGGMVHGFLFIEVYQQAGFPGLAADSCELLSSELYLYDCGSFVLERLPPYPATVTFCGDVGCWEHHRESWVRWGERYDREALVALTSSLPGTIQVWQNVTTSRSASITLQALSPVAPFHPLPFFPLATVLLLGASVCAIGALAAHRRVTVLQRAADEEVRAWRADQAAREAAADARREAEAARARAEQIAEMRRRAGQAVKGRLMVLEKAIAEGLLGAGRRDVIARRRREIENAQSDDERYAVHEKLQVLEKELSEALSARALAEERAKKRRERVRRAESEFRVLGAVVNHPTAGETRELLRRAAGGDDEALQEAEDHLRDWRRGIELPHQLSYQREASLQEEALAHERALKDEATRRETELRAKEIEAQERLERLRQEAATARSREEIAAADARATRTREHVVRTRGPVSCGFCRGTGSRDFDHRPPACEICGGSGKHDVPQPALRCGPCSGTGSRDRDYKRPLCGTCGGIGWSQSR